MSNIVDQYRIAQEPYYRAVADEVELFEAAYSVRMPMMLKGPTGCGKTRFVEYMAYRLGKPLSTPRRASSTRASPGTSRSSCRTSRTSRSCCTRG